MKNVNENTKSKQQINIKQNQFELPQMSLMSLLQFGSQTLLEEAIKAEITEVLGRSFYEHGDNVQSNGYRHGTRKTTIDTPLGPVVYNKPRVTGIDFQSQFHCIEYL